jgi:hypothetical protein
MYGMTSGRCGRAPKASVLRGEAFLVTRMDMWWNLW